MKKILLIAVSVTAITLTAEKINAQGFYLNAGAGYGFSLAPQYMGANVSSNSIEAVRSSLGKGVNAGVGFGYMFNENIGMDLGVNYLMGSTTTFTDNSSDNNAEDVRTVKANMLRINPAVKITFGETVKPYAKMGLVVGVAGKITRTDEDNAGAPIFPVKTESTEVYTGGVSLGLSGALGLDIMFSESIGIYVELGALAQSYAPTRSEITRYDVNGSDQLPGFTTHDKETEYVSDYDPTDPDNDESKPDQQLKSYSPFSTWGLNLGVHIAFGGE